MSKIKIALAFAAFLLISACESKENHFYHIQNSTTVDIDVEEYRDSLETITYTIAPGDVYSWESGENLSQNMRFNLKGVDSLKMTFFNNKSIVFYSSQMGVDSLGYPIPTQVNTSRLNSAIQGIEVQGLKNILLEQNWKLETEEQEVNRRDYSFEVTQAYYNYTH